MNIKCDSSEYQNIPTTNEGINLGEHCAVITKAYETERSGYQMLIIEFDFAKSDVQTDLIARKSEGRDSWHPSGQYTIFLGNDYTLTNIKKLATALKDSNNGYEWVKKSKDGIDVDLDGVVGKEVGVCMGLVEFKIKKGKDAGTIGKSPKCRWFLDINKVDYGENVPPVKTLNGNNSESKASTDSEGFNKVDDSVDMDSLPFV